LQCQAKTGRLTKVTAITDAPFLNKRRRERARPILSGDSDTRSAAPFFSSSVFLSSMTLPSPFTQPLLFRRRISNIQPSCCDLFHINNKRFSKPGISANQQNPSNKKKSNKLIQCNKKKNSDKNFKAGKALRIISGCFINQQIHSGRKTLCLKSPIMPNTSTT